MFDIDKLKADLRNFEEVRLQRYSLDGGTIGVGHLLAYPITVRGVTYGPKTELITMDEAEAILSYDIEDKVTRMDASMGWWRNTTDLQQQGLVHMAFNMGVPRMLGFVKMLAAVKLLDPVTQRKTILQEGRDSKWYRSIGLCRPDYVLLQIADVASTIRPRDPRAKTKLEELLK